MGRGKQEKLYGKLKPEQPQIQNTTSVCNGQYEVKRNIKKMFLKMFLEIKQP